MIETIFPTRESGPYSLKMSRIKPTAAELDTILTRMIGITGTGIWQSAAGIFRSSDTASRILSYKGVLLKKHLLEGVKKGAFDEAAAEAKFEAWMKEKEAKIQAKIQKLAQAGDAAAKAALEAEAKVRAAKEEIIAKKKAELAAAEAAKKAEEEAAAAPEEAAAEAPAAE